MELVPGASLGPYRIVEQVGRGGMATVFKAFQPALNRYVAIKVLPTALAADPQFEDRFTQEAMAVASLRHPNILTVYDYGQAEGVTYLVTEFVDGDTLGDQMHGPLPLDYVISMLRPVASALDYAHSRAIVHRDVKPANVLLTRDGTAVLADFGLARMMDVDRHLTQAGMILGTPEYMAPEQCAGTDPGPAADQYSLAVIAYQMLTGKVPFSAETPAAVIIAQMTKPLPPPRQVNHELSEAVEAALLKGLAKEPGDRFPSASAFLRALEQSPVAAAAATVIAPPAAVAAPRRPRPVPRAALLAAALIVVVVVGTSVALVLARGGSAARSPSAADRTATAGVTPSAATTPTATPAVLVRGALLYQAPLDGSGNEFVNRWHSGDPSSAAIRASAGAVEFAILKPDGNEGAMLNFNPPYRYLTEIELTATPGAAVQFLWIVRTGNAVTPPGNHIVIIDVAAETAQFVFFEQPPSPAATPKPLQALAAAVKVKALQTGARVTLSTVVDPPLYRLFVDGSLVSEVRDERTDSIPNIAFAAYGRGGSVTLTGVRVFASTS